MELLIDSMTAIVAESKLEDGTRQLAVEVLITVCTEAAPTARKFPSLCAKLVPQLIQWCGMIEDDDEWSKKAEEEEDDADSLATIGEQSLDRIACALGGNAVLPTAFSLLPGLLSGEAWQGRCAALITIGAIAEGCKKQMRASLKDVVAQCVPRLTDPHPRVRFAACNTIGQFSIDFAPTAGHSGGSSFQAAYHSQVIPALLTLMQDVENPRVQAHGAAALVNFVEHMRKDELDQYLDALLTRLATMLQPPNRQRHREPTGDQPRYEPVQASP